MTTTPARINFRIYPDATFSEVALLRDDAGLPIDISGRTARMQIRRDRDDDDPIFELTTENGGITTGVDGSVTINIAASATYPTLTPPIDRDGESWVHDLLLITPGATPVVERLYQGSITVLPGVTTRV